MSKNTVKDRTDWDRVRTMTDEEVTAAALFDPDCPPRTSEGGVRLGELPGETLVEKLKSLKGRQVS